MIKDLRTFRHLSLSNYYISTAGLLLLPLLLLWLSRFIFAAYNAQLVGDPSFWRVMQLSLGGLRFDLSVWAYTNVLFIAMRFLPVPTVSCRWYIAVTNVIYVATNSLMLWLALADIPFFRFSGSRLRLPALTDMFHDPNMHSIILSYATDYWWAFAGALLVTAVLAGACIWLKPTQPPAKFHSTAATYGVRAAIFLAVGFSTFCAMRGTLVKGRPLSIADAVWYTATPPETNVVLNTPFCVLRSVEGGTRVPEMRFFSDKEAEQIRSSLHTPSFPPDSLLRKNVMVITLESGSQHWIDRLNDIPGCPPHVVMPFLDSLASVSLVNRNVMATGRRSVEGIAAIYGGFPTFGDMLYMSSPYNANTIDSYARLLRDEGFSTRFYFGCNHGSYSIDSFLSAMGYDLIADRQVYADDSEYDGLWGIYDDAMGAYAAKDLTTLREPFVAGWFTLHLHEPFSVPARISLDSFKHREPSPLRSAEYTDMALRRFFETARLQPWYSNTIFIITGDHGSRDFKDTPYDGAFIQPHVMFMIYTPDGSIPAGEISGRMMNQFDIGPTILGLLRYGKPYVATGTDVINSSDPNYAIGFFNGQYQITGTRYLITMTPDLGRIERVFDVTADPLLNQPLTTYDTSETDRMMKWARAFMQDYTMRLNQNRLHFQR